MSGLPRVDIDMPRLDQSTYLNRAKHFIVLTNPLNVFVSSAELDRAARIVRDYKYTSPSFLTITIINNAHILILIHFIPRMLHLCPCPCLNINK